MLVGEFSGGADGHGHDDDAKAGEARGLARRNDVSSGGGRPPARPPWRQGHLAESERGNFSPPPLRDLAVWSSVGMTGGQRRRLFRDVNGACDALNWTHGEDESMSSC